MKAARLTTVSAQPDIEILNEVKMSRVYSHLKGDAPVAIITAFRGEETLEHNVKMNRELASGLRSSGFGFIWVDGAWIENRGEADERHASEVSIMTIGADNSDEKMFSFLVSAAQKYNQDGFIFKATGKLPVKLYDKQGKEIMSFDRVNMDSISNMYTRLRSGSHAGRSFVFESERVPIGFMGRMQGLVD